MQHKGPCVHMMVASLLYITAEGTLSKALNPSLIYVTANKLPSASAPPPHKRSAEFLSMRSSQMPNWGGADPPVWRGAGSRGLRFPKINRLVNYLCPETRKQYNQINAKYISLWEECESLSPRERTPVRMDFIFWMYSGKTPIYILLIFPSHHQPRLKQIGWFKGDI